ncbi:uncharacterized protein LOC114755794 [Neltuma alba]|uniref:uncharacterized protein LOC114755794 n=1 Tax=Neltuma alba TaxID=207710 RepID=UPI0010A326C4|nr:uncharacterized protein LOC114755794 [Prosopis alba]
MASKLLRNRIKPKDHQRTDVLALEKAAAWAWHQHGSGSEGKTIREFHITRAQHDYKPSRYKLEALRMASSCSPETKEEQGSCQVQHSKKLPLLDAYEVRSILTRLDRLVAESSDGKLENGFGSANACLDDNGGQRMKNKKKKKKKKRVGNGIWERRRVRVICSTRKEDVVDATRDRKENQFRLSANCVPATKRSIPKANNGHRRVV